MLKTQTAKQTLKSLFADNGVVAAFSRRIDGNMSLCHGATENSLTNRANFLEGLGMDYQNLVCAKQIHTSNIKLAIAKDTGRGALSYDTAIKATDALIAKDKNLPLAVFTADCLPIFLFDAATPAIGLAHAGWRSSKVNIVKKTIRAMQDAFGTKAGSLQVIFGPRINICCYEVGEEFADYFPQGIRRKGSRYYLDLGEINKGQALSMGVKDDNILDLGLCTYCRGDEFFSFRREGESCGRMMSVIMLKGHPSSQS
ncbi:MAG: peptidoglycan editing factor PgeF [Candidatus Omnitrophota bacterium]